MNTDFIIFEDCGKRWFWTGKRTGWTTNIKDAYVYPDYEHAQAAFDRATSKGGTALTATKNAGYCTLEEYEEMESIFNTPCDADFDNAQSSIADAIEKCIEITRKDIPFAEQEKLRECAQLLRVANDRIARIKRNVMEEKL